MNTAVTHGADTAMAVEEAEESVIFRRCKVYYNERGGKGARAWREYVERHAWVPVEEAKKGAVVSVSWPDVGERKVTIIDLDVLCLPGRYLPHCHYNVAEDCS